MQRKDVLEFGKDADPARGDVRFLHGRVPPPGTLPRGQHDLPPEYVAQHQRVRILDATTHVLGERGYGPATIADIVARARVSRRTFYDHFETKEHCVLATFGAAVECIADAVREAYAEEEEWDTQMAAGLTALMRILVEHPHVARTCFLEARAAGVAAEERMTAAGDMATAALRRSLTERPDSSPVSAMTLEMAIGGLTTVIRSRVAAGRVEALERDLPEIAVAFLQPLAGPDTANAVAQRIAAPHQERTTEAI